MGIKINTDIQIRFADVDILRHVNNVNLQHYFDIGKNQYCMQVLGLAHDFNEFGLITAATNTSYLAQTRLADKIYVQTEVLKTGTKSITLFQRIIEHKTHEVRAESTSVMVVFDFKAQKSTPIPQTWLEKLQRNNKGGFL